MLNWTRRRPTIAGLLAVSTIGSLALIALAAAYIVQLGSARETAEVLRADAEASAESAGQFMYASQMRQAYEWLDQGLISRVEKLLDEYKPGSRLAHLRSFEWYHLKRHVHSERLSLPTPHGEVYAVTFSPDGRLLVSGGEDGSIRFWDPRSGQELASIVGHRSCVNVVTYSPDGQILASASCDHTIKLWQSTTHELLATLDDHTNEVHCLAFSPDGSKLASGGHDQIVRVWDVSTRKVVNSLVTVNWIDSLAWLSDGRAVVTDGGSGGVTLWNLDTNQHSEHGHVDCTFAVSPATSDVFLPQRDGHFENWKSDFSSKMDGQLGSKMAGGWGNVTGLPKSIAFSHDGARWASGGDDAVLRLWLRGDEPHARALSGHAGRIQAIAFHPRDDLIATGSFDGTVKLWGSLNSEAIPRLQSSYFDHTYAVAQKRLHGVTISPNFRWIAVRKSATDVVVFNLADAAHVETIGISPQTTRGLNFLIAEPGILFGIWQDDKRVVKWDIAHNASAGSVPVDVADLIDPEAQPVHLSLSTDGRHLIRADGKNVTITDTKSGHVWFNQAVKWSGIADGSRIRISPDGKTVGVSMFNDGGWIVDLESCQQRYCKWQGVMAIANHARLIAYPISPALAITEIDSGREVCMLQHNAEIHCAAFSPDSRTIATASADGRVYLWSVATGEQITQFDPRAVISKMQFSVDGHKLAAVSLDGANSGPEGSEGMVSVFVWEGVVTRVA